MRSEESQRTEVMQFRVTPRERELIEKYAKKDGTTVSQYARATLIMEMATVQGDVEAMRIIFTTLGRIANESIRRRFSQALGEERA